MSPRTQPILCVNCLPRARRGFQFPSLAHLDLAVRMARPACPSGSIPLARATPLTAPSPHVPLANVVQPVPVAPSTPALPRSDPAARELPATQRKRAAKMPGLEHTIRNADGEPVSALVQAYRFKFGVLDLPVDDPRRVEFELNLARDAAETSSVGGAAGAAGPSSAGASAGAMGQHNIGMARHRVAASAAQQRANHGLAASSYNSYVRVWIGIENFIFEALPLEHPDRVMVDRWRGVRADDGTLLTPPDPLFDRPLGDSLELFYLMMTGAKDQPCGPTAADGTFLYPAMIGRGVAGASLRQVSKAVAHFHLKYSRNPATDKPFTREFHSEREELMGAVKQREAQVPTQHHKAFEIVNGLTEMRRVCFDEKGPFADKPNLAIYAWFVIMFMVSLIKRVSDFTYNGDKLGAANATNQASSSARHARTRRASSCCSCHAAHAHFHYGTTALLAPSAGAVRHGHRPTHRHQHRHLPRGYANTARLCRRHADRPEGRQRRVHGRVPRTERGAPIAQQHLRSGRLLPGRRLLPLRLARTLQRRDRQQTRALRGSSTPAPLPTLCGRDRLLLLFRADPVH